MLAFDSLKMLSGKEHTTHICIISKVKPLKSVIRFKLLERKKDRNERRGCASLSTGPIKKRKRGSGLKMKYTTLIIKNLWDLSSFGL